MSSPSNNETEQQSSSTTVEKQEIISATTSDLIEAPIEITINPNSISPAAFTCTICKLPYSNPAQCMQCDNIFCRACLESYMFQHQSCPGAACKTVLNPLRISRNKQLAFGSIQATCNLCKCSFPVLDTQQHLETHHKDSFVICSQSPLLKKLPKIEQVLAPRSFPHEQEYLYSCVDSYEILANDDPRLNTIQCQICFESVAYESTQCMQCENVWCTACLNRLTHVNKLLRCPYRCKTPRFVKPTRAFLIENSYISTYARKCNMCEQIVPSEYTQEHNRRSHGIFTEIPDIAQEYFKEAGKKQDTDKQTLQSKIDLLTLAIKSQHNFLKAFAQKGEAYMQNKQHIAAIISIRQAMTPQMLQHSVDFYNLAINFQEIGMFDEYVTYIRKAISANLSYAAARESLALYLHKQGDLDTAWCYLEIVLQQQPNRFQSLVQRGDIFLDLDNDEEARADFVKASLISPSYALAPFGMARYFLKQNNKDQAIKYLNECLDLDQSFKEAQVLKDKILLQIAEEELKELNQSINPNTNPDNL